MNVPLLFRDRQLMFAGSVPALADQRPDVARTLRFGYVALAVVVFVFGCWAVFAPLSSAAIAPGLLKAEGGGRKVVQHLEGGIVQQILVREGDLVKAGQTLVVLDGTQAVARDSSLQQQYDALIAQDARLTAERFGRGSVTYPASLLRRGEEPSVRAVIDASDTLFAARRQALAAQVSVLEQRLAQSRAEIAGFGSQLAATGSQRTLLANELEGVSTLVNEGLERKSRLLSLQRQIASADGQQGQLRSSMVRSTDSIGEVRSQIAFLRRQQENEAAAQQRDVQTQIADMEEKLNVSRDVNQRREVVAPVSGRVINLRLVTPRGVIGAGQPILDIVPDNAPIVIVARVRPNDMDVVHRGLPAEIRLTPYKARLLPLLKGTVTNVSPDAMSDEATRSMYYEVEVALDRDQLRHLEHVTLISGMPAEVFIKLGDRSLLEYITQPVVDSFHRALREP